MSVACIVIAIIGWVNNFSTWLCVLLTILSVLFAVGDLFLLRYAFVNDKEDKE